jgi:xanthine dehydrogenase YagR molybdenum-binding subunit
MLDKTTSNKEIGKALNRVDGRLKVTGQAQYSAEVKLPNLAYGVVVQSTIARGRIKDIDTSKAISSPDINVFSYAHRPQPLRKPGKSDNLFLFDDPIIRYHGQIIALVTADSLESAKRAAALLKISYEEQKAETSLQLAMSNEKHQLLVPKEEANSKRGDFSSAFKAAPIKISETYTTPVETHNPMEPFATTAVWQGGSLTVYDSTQAVFVTRDTLAETLGLPAKQVRVISRFIGGGFGCKLSVWSHVPLTAMAARHINRPLKLVLDRAQMFGPVGFRPSTIQKLSIAADKNGQLKAINHEVVSETSSFAEFVETATVCAKSTYACDNVDTSQRILRLDIGKPTWMRAPGHATGSFAVESAMDELAVALGIDPLELRIKNFADKDPDSKLPWSSNVLSDCYRQGAERFGWKNRVAKPGSITREGQFVGMGMATSLHASWRNPASASVKLLSDGTALVQSGTQDIGTGTYTVMSQIAAEKLALPVSKVKFELGDTNMPPGPMSGGSTTALSVGPPVAMAALAAIKKLIEVAIEDKQSPLFGAKAEAVSADNGTLSLKDDKRKSETYGAILKRTKSKSLEARYDNTPGNEESKYSMSSFGAQFAEVEVDPDFGTVRVSRFVGAYSGGVILNPKTARSQMIGGIIFGISMALHEQTVTDHNLNCIINNNLAEYNLPVHADIANLEPFFVEEHDPIINTLGVKGIGELGITGAAAAIANAVYNATGKRIRDLPITLDKVMS